MAGQSRITDNDDLFNHENHEFPPSLSDMGRLRFGKKSDLLDELEKLSLSSPNNLNLDSKIFDGAVLVHMLRPQGCRTFGDYAKKVFIPYVENELRTIQRADVIWDQYSPNSLKRSVCENEQVVAVYKGKR